MNKNLSQEMDRLIAQGRIGGADLDRALDRLKSQRTESSPREKHPKGIWILAAASACMLLFAGFFLLPRNSQDGSGLFSTKGSASSPVFEIGCRHGETVSRERCQLQDTLMIRYEGLLGEAYLAAFATHGDEPRIWYFPDSSGMLPRLAPSDDPVFVRQTVNIGNEHSEGTYQIVLVVLDKVLPRSDIDCSTAVACYSFNVTIGMKNKKD